MKIQFEVCDKCGCLLTYDFERAVIKYDRLTKERNLSLCISCAAELKLVLDTFSQSSEALAKKTTKGLSNHIYISGKALGGPDESS